MEMKTKEMKRTRKQLCEKDTMCILLEFQTITTYSPHNADNENASPNSLNILVTKGPVLAKA